jgi:AcrR family transcriptional regulator
VSTPVAARATAPQRGAGRERILAEAYTLFLARGFADVSMQHIANASGVTKAALYYHFASKEDLFVAVVRQAVNDFWTEIITRAEAPGSLADTLRGIADYVINAFQHTAVHRLMEDTHARLPPETLKDIFNEHPLPTTSLCALFERAIASGEMRPLRDPLAAAAMFIGMTMGIVDAFHGERESQPDDADLLVDVFLHGVAGESPHPPAPSPARGGGAGSGT